MQSSSDTHKLALPHFLKAQQNNTTCSCLILSSADTHCGEDPRRCTDKKNLHPPPSEFSIWLLMRLYCTSPGVKGSRRKGEEERQKQESDGAVLR